MRPEQYSAYLNKKSSENLRKGEGVTTCLIPILVMIFFIWIVKIILSTAVTQPGAVVPKLIKTGKENRE